MFKKKILKNGMRIIVAPMKDAPSVTIMALVEAGSEYETKEKNGLSHFLEHMVFKGTKKRPSSLHIAKEFDAMGAENNAFTGNEYTGYFGKAHPKFTDKILDIIADIYLNPEFPEAEMEKEKGVIIEEINMYEDLPQRKVHAVFSELLYGDTPYGWSILGPAENIKKMKREDFLNYRKTHYVAGKTAIIAAGNVRVDDFFRKAEKAFKNIPTGETIAKPKAKELQKNPQIKIHQKETDQTHLVIGVRAFEAGDKRMPALRLLAAILGGGMSSRLFQKMREELGICYYVKSGVNDFTDHGHFIIFAGVDKNRLNTAVSEILQEIRKIGERKISKEELQKTKDYMIGNMYLGLESSDSLVEFYGMQEIMRQKLKTPEMIEKEIRKVTAKEIQRLAKEIFQNDNLNMAIVGSPQDEPGLRKLFKL